MRLAVAGRAEDEKAFSFGDVLPQVLGVEGCRPVGRLGAGQRLPGVEAAAPEARPQARVLKEPVHALLLFAGLPLPVRLLTLFYLALTRPAVAVDAPE